VAGERYGALDLRHGADVFSNEEVELLSELAADLGYGVTTLRCAPSSCATQRNQRAEHRPRMARAGRTADLEAAREREATVGFKIQQMLLLTQPPTDVPGVEVASVPSFAAVSTATSRFLSNMTTTSTDRRRRHGKGVPAALLAAATKSNFLEALCHLVAVSRGDRMRSQGS